MKEFGLKNPYQNRQKRRYVKVFLHTPSNIITEKKNLNPSVDLIKI